MERKDIEKKVNDVLVDILGVDPSEIKDEADFREDLNGDSLDCVEVIMELEKVFDIYIKDEEADESKTVKQIYDMVESMV